MTQTQGYFYPWPRVAFTADVVALRQGKEIEVLLIRRGNPPFKGAYALPGGFVDPAESAIVAARRELKEETGLEAGELFDFATLDAPGRDPRGRTVTRIFLAELPSGIIEAGDDAVEAKLFPLDNLPPLAFDHGVLLESVRQFLQREATDSSLQRFRNLFI